MRNVPRPSRNRPPKSGVRGVRPVWSRGKWRWQAFVRRRAGVPPQRVGHLRDSRDEAAQDFLDISRSWDEELRSLRGNRAAAAHAVPTNPHATFGQAVQLAIERARLRGAGDYYMRRQVEYEARFVLGLIKADRPIARIGVDDILTFVRVARATGRKIQTIKRKDLGMIDQAFRAAGVPSPVPAAREQIVQREPRAPRTAMPIEDVREIIQRIRDADPKKYRRAVRHADILELAAYTGIRAGEFERLRAEDLDVQHCVVHVREAKNRARPRSLPIPTRMLPVLQRLRAEADPETGRIIPGGMPSLSSLCSDWKERLDDRRINMRNLRRAVASHLARKAVPVVDVSKILGHTSTSTTDRYLSSLLEGEKLRATLAVLDDEHHGVKSNAVGARRKPSRKHRSAG